MQVKKFEAKTMKDALAMVKSDLGPDAIILQAKDYKKGFGIGGGASVELTAAISEQKYKERQFALARLKEEEKERLRQATAKTQKKFVEKAVNRFYEEHRLKEKRQMPKRPQYISINDDNDIISNSISDIETHPDIESHNDTRVKNATMSALDAFKKDFFEQNKATAKAANQLKSKKMNVSDLELEIQRLQGVIRSFNEVPQEIIENHSGHDLGLCKEVSPAFDRLVATGVAKDLAGDILKVAQESMSKEQLAKKALVEAWVAKYILESTNVSDDKTDKQIQLFLGAAGSGKTASLVKYASYQIIVNRKSIAILTTDTQKVGAIEQLKIYAKILNVPFAVIQREEDWEPILNQLTNIDMVLVDTPGSSLKDLEAIDGVKKRISPILEKARVHYVMSATSNEEPALEMARRYKMFHYHDIIATKLDESVHHGLLYTVHQKMGCPLHSFGIGTKVPEDYELASRERVLDLLFKITKTKKG